MKKIVIFGAVLAAFLMLMMPAITAENGKVLENKLNEPELNLKEKLSLLKDYEPKPGERLICALLSIMIIILTYDWAKGHGDN